MGTVKTTLEIPDQVFRKTKAKAAARGLSLREFVTEALQEKLAVKPGSGRQAGWMRGFGKLKRLRKETARIQATIDATFETIEAEDRQ